MDYNDRIVNLSASLQKFVYAAVILLGAGFVGVTISAIYGNQQAENRFTVDLIFYIGLILGAIGFLCLAFIMYYRFNKRNQY